MTIIDQQDTIVLAPARFRGLRQTSLYLLRRYPLGAVGAAIVLAIVLMALFANWLTAFDPTATNSAASLARPGGAHLLGADFMGPGLWGPDFFRRGFFPLGRVGLTRLGFFIGSVVGPIVRFFGRLPGLHGAGFKELLQSLPLLVMALVM